MKLDKIRFAKVVGAIERQHAINMSEDEISRLDDLITFDAPQPASVYPEVSDINELMRIMAAGTNKIDAIRIHRKLTGYGLKDSKEEIERHWGREPVLAKLHDFQEQ